MTTHDRAGTIPARRSVSARTARTALGPVHRAVAAPAITRESVMVKQDTEPAESSKDPGPPTTPLEAEAQPESTQELKNDELEEARDLEKEPGTEEEKGAVMDWFDRIGE